MFIIRKLILIGFIISTIACVSSRSNNNDAKGKYVWKPFYGVAESLELKSDDTFLFKWQQGLINGETKGSYTIIKNNLFLSSSKQPVKTEKFNVRDLSIDKKLNGYFIKVLDESNIPLEFANCVFLNDSLTIGGTVTKRDGSIIIPKNADIKKINISFVGYNEAEINLNNLTSNRIEVKLFLAPEYYIFFTNEHLKIRGKRISRSYSTYNGIKKTKVYKKNK